MISQPPPKARPLTAAITGFLNASSRAVIAWPRRTKSRTARSRQANAAGKFVDVGAGGKRAFAGAGQHHDARAGVDLDRVQRRHQAVDQLVVERVELVGPVERDQRDPVIDFEQYGVGHQVVSGSVGVARSIGAGPD